MNWNKKIYNVILIALISLPCSYFLGYLFNCLISNRFSLKLSARLLIDGRTFLYMTLILIVEGLAFLLYYYTHYWLLNSKNIISALVKKKWTQAERLLVTSPIYSVQWLEVLASSIVPCIGQVLGNRGQTRASPC